MDHVCTQMLSVNLQRGIISLPTFSRNRKCNIRLCMISCKSSSTHSVWRPPFSTVRSFKVDVATNGNHVSYGSLAPNDFPRFKLSDKLNDFERDVEELFNEVKNLIVKGNKDEALELLEANYEAVKEQIDAGSKSVEEAAILDVIALGYTSIGDLKIAGSLLDMLNVLADSLNDDEPLLGPILIHMGSMYSTLGRFEKSMLVFRRVLGIIESAYGKDSTFLVTPLLGMAKVNGSVGRSSKAMDIYHRAINILELSRGVESEDLVVPLLSLGNLLINEGKATDAEIYLIRIVNIYKKIYGENDGRVGMAMCSLANVECAKGNAEEAILLYKDALQVITDSNYMALDDNVVEKMRVDLAELLHAVGRANEGRELLEECLTITEKYKGKDHPSSVTHLINLATSFTLSKNYVEAERLLRMSLKVMMKSVEPDDQSITFPMLQLAVTLYHLNRNDEAEQLALDVLRIREKAFGNESIPVGEALECLMSIQRRLGKEECEIVNLLKRIMKIQEKEFGNDSKEVMETLKKIVFCFNKMGMENLIPPLKRRLSVLGKKHQQMVA